MIGKYANKLPWEKSYFRIKSRCSDSKNKRYGGRGIKCLITPLELKKIWLRDKGWLLKQPSIDRKDNDGNYEYKNCRYVERSFNSSKGDRKSTSEPCPAGHSYKGDNLRINKKGHRLCIACARAHSAKWNLIMRGPKIGRFKTHCKYGHEFTEKNTYYRTLDNRRICKKCDQARKIDRKKQKEPNDKA